MDAPQLRDEVRPAGAGLLVLLLLWFLLPALRAQSTGVVEGTVNNNVTRMGIAGAKVSLALEDGGASVSATSDAQGRFRVEGLAPGRYTATVEHNGFADPQSDELAKAKFTIGGGDTAPVQVELMPRATLRGRLLDADGKPMPGIQVQLLRLRYPGSYQSTTNEKGEFTFANVRPTAYVVAADPRLGAAGPKPSRGKERELHWMRTYYPGVMRRTEAAPIVIPAGSDIAGYEFRVQSAPGFRVAGKVVDEDGKPVVDAQVRLRSAEEDFDWPVTNKTGKDGAFEFDGVPAGSWRAVAQVSVERRYRLGPKSAFVVADDTDVQGAATSGQNPPDPVVRAYADRLVTLYQAQTSEKSIGKPPDEPADAHPPMEILVITANDGARGTGTVEIRDQNPEPVEMRVEKPFTIPFSAERREGESSQSQTSEGSVRLEPADGIGYGISADFSRNGVRQFEEVFSGRYRIQVDREDPGCYLSAVLLGEREILGKVFELTPGAPPIRAIFQPNPGTVRGTVDGSNHATVVLLPVDETLRDLQSLDRARTDANGRFEIDGLRPGDYYALAFERVDVEALKDAAFVRMLIQRATAVKVERGAAAVLKLSVTLWPE